MLCLVDGLRYFNLRFQDIVKCPSLLEFSRGMAHFRQPENFPSHQLVVDSHHDIYYPNYPMTIMIYIYWYIYIHIDIYYSYTINTLLIPEYIPQLIPWFPIVKPFCHVAMSQAAMGGATHEAQQICRRGGYLFLWFFVGNPKFWMICIGLIHVNTG